jgi:hypothetical protein
MRIDAENGAVVADFHHLDEEQELRIGIKLKSRIRIRIRIKVKSRIHVRIRIKVKSQIQFRIKL